MSAITSIKPQRNKQRVSVYLDGKFGFGVDLETYVKSKLKVGQELSQSEMDKLKQSSDNSLAYGNLLRFATLRPRSEKEIGDWFYKKKIEKGLQNKLIIKLKKLELYDDEKFAKWWVEQRISFKSKSIKELVYELRGKGIEKDIIEKVLAESDVDEVGSAKKLLLKNMYKWRKLEESKAKRKMGDYLLRKGFSWDIVKLAIERLDD